MLSPCLVPPVFCTRALQPGMKPNPLCTQLPVFDLSVFLNAPDKDAPDVQRLCAALAACLQQSSALVVRGE